MDAAKFNAILQRQMPLPVWGWCKPNATVTVEFAGQKKAAKAVDHEKTNEDLINFLEQKLEEIEKKQSTTQNEYDILKGDYTSLLDKFNLSREKYKRAALLLTDYLDDLLNTTPNLLSHEQDMHLNLDKMHVCVFSPFVLVQQGDAY